ncbi:diacylglycerol kinase family protein [Emcibacter sp.]|uniref:diacylglycerol kinase family protein n=1 Tax=Emcibacter sp. TaxID=1979954 RepID=UPI002AA7B06F|nr:diacylglycerol kinase family protein [Emcibacter sp.]
MSVIAILSSPSSFKNSDEMDRLRQVISSGSGIVHYEVEKHRHIGEALATFKKTGAEAIIIIGGQALAAATFEFLIEKDPFEGEMPPLAILPAGDNNIIAESMGAQSASPHRELARLLKRRKSGRLLENTLTCPLLKVEGVYGVGTVYGLYFCCGEVTRSKNVFAGNFSGASILGRAKRRLSTMGFIRRASLRAMKDKGMDSAVRVNLNQRGAVVGRYFMICITSLQKVLMGASLPGPADPDKLRYLSIENTSDALLATGRQLLKGRFEDRIIPGQVIRKIAHARIVQHKPFVLDGSFFEAEQSGELLISSTVRLSFLML